MMIPNDCLPILIGKNNDTLKMLVNMSGVENIKIANEGISGAVDRKLFIYGKKESFDRSKKMV